MRWKFAKSSYIEISLLRFQIESIVGLNGGSVIAIMRLIFIINEFKVVTR